MKLAIFGARAKALFMGAIAKWMRPSHAKLRDLFHFSNAHSFRQPLHLMAKSKQTTRPQKRRIK